MSDSWKDICKIPPLMQDTHIYDQLAAPIQLFLQLTAMFYQDKKNDSPNQQIQ